MKTLTLLLCVFLGVSYSSIAQTPYSTIASNRIIQKHHHPSKIETIHRLDSARLEVLWQYFSNSFSFETNGTPITVQELMNIQQFDITEFEHLRQQNTTAHVMYRNSISITLKSINDLQVLLQGYDLNELVNKVPQRPFPLWTSGQFTALDFENYKKEVWAWAKDYPEEYLQITADPNYLHIHFQDFKDLDNSRRSQILNQQLYLIID
jgi:hypothetical protein